MIRSNTHLDHKIMMEAAKPGKGVLNEDPNSPDGPSGLYFWHEMPSGKQRKVRIPNRAFVPNDEEGF